MASDPLDEGLVTSRALWQRMTEPSDAVEGAENRRRARLLSALLIVLIPFTLTGAVTSVILNRGEVTGPLLSQFITAVVAIAAYPLSRTRYYNVAAALVLGALAATPFVAVLVQRTRTPLSVYRGLIWAVLPVVLSSIFLPLQGVALLAGANLAALALVPVILSEVGYAQIGDVLGFVGVVTGALLLSVRNRDVEERLRQKALTDSNRELRDVRASLEERVAERTADLAQRARYLEATSSVARETASILGDTQALLRRVVDLVSEQFGVYHAGLFLLAPGGEWAELVAASSAGGQRMLARGHRLQVGVQGIVGSTAGSGQPRIALDVGDDAAFFDNPDLPATRSEIALPLRARGEIIGVLDVQSTEPAAFSQEDADVLQSLAGQVAVAIDNARLFQQVEEAVEADRRARGDRVGLAWRRLLLDEPNLGYLGNREGVIKAGDEWQPEMDEALRTASAAVGETDRARLAIPIRVGGQVIGVLDGCKRQDGGIWTDGEVALFEALGEQLSEAVERARLYRETQRRAMRERTVAEVGARVRSSLDLETMLRTAADEMRQALDLSDLVVRLAAPEGGEDAA